MMINSRKSSGLVLALGYIWGTACGGSTVVGSVQEVQDEVEGDSTAGQTDDDISELATDSTDVQPPHESPSNEGTPSLDPISMPDDAGTSTTAKCRGDDDCDSGTFCDRGECLAYGVNGELGLDCSFLPVDADSQADTTEANPCGIFVCKAGTCRSCENASECNDGLECQERSGYPGAFCAPPQ